MKWYRCKYDQCSAELEGFGGVHHVGCTEDDIPSDTVPIQDISIYIELLQCVPLGTTKNIWFFPTAILKSLKQDTAEASVLGL